jgi:hypothetical protein
MERDLILLPFAVMMLLTFAVWLRLYSVRIPAMRRQRVHPQKLATRGQKAGVYLGDAEARASDHFMNLFELPVLFYVLCLALYGTEQVDGVYLGLAWAFVVLRVLHSAIQLFYNRVMDRFLAYFAGGLVLLVAILRFAWSIAS